MSLTPDVVEIRHQARRLDNLARLAELNGGHLPERRDPIGATVGTQRYLTPGSPMIPEWNAENSVQMAFYANVIVYRCMQILANTVAACPFRAGPKQPAQPGANAEYDETCRLAQLLGPPPGGPAPMLTARRLWAWTVVQRRVTGRHGWEIETTQPRGKGEVVALWPLVSSMLRAVPSTSGAAWWQRFEYGPEFDANKCRNLTIDQVLYGWDPSAKDFREPESPLQAARYDISIAVLMDRYSVGFLRNDARPAAVVVTDAFASDDDFRRWKLSWYGEFGGPDNANKTAFMEMDDNSSLKPSEAMFVHTLGLSQKDARFIEQHRASLERVAMACGVPWSKLDASGRTFDNAGEEDETFWMLTMLPLLSDLGDEVNIQLAPRIGREVGWFDLSHVKVFQPAKTVQAVGAPALLQARITTVNEARELTGLPPVEGGDRFLTDDELAALKGVLGGALPSAAAASEPEQRAHIPSVQEIAAAVSDLLGGRLAEIGRASAPGDHGEPPAVVALAELSERASSDPIFERRETDEEARERRARIWKATVATVTTLEARWTKAMRKLFARQQKAALSRLEGNRGRRIAEHRASADDVFDPAFWTGETEDDVAALYELVASAGFARMSQQFGISFDLEAEFAQDFIQARANQLAGQVTDTTYQAIKDQLAAGVDAGESIPDLAERIKHVFDVASTSRAEMIARTETISAFNGSASLAAAQLPDDVVGGQEWIATMSPRTRDEHAEADGQVVGIGEPFDVGGEQLAYPGDPAGSPGNVVNCRCAIGFLTPDEMDDRARPHPHHRSQLAAALAVLALVEPGRPFDELAIRRALRQETAA